MPRISTYNPDSSLSGEDKVIGSSYEGQDVNGPVYVTKNYTLSQLAQFFGSFINTGDVLINIEEIQQNVTNNTNSIATANLSITTITNELLAQSTFQVNLSSTFGTFDEFGNLTSLSQAFADQVLQTTASDRYANAQFVTNLAASVGTYDANGNLVTLGQAFADQVLSATASDRFATSTFATNLAASFGTYNPDGTLSTISESFANQLLQASTASDFADAQFLTNLVSNFGTFDEEGNILTVSDSYANQILQTANTAEFAQASFVTNLATSFGTYDANGNLLTVSSSFADDVLSTANTAEFAQASKLTALGASFGTVNPDGSVSFTNTSTYASEILNYVDSSSALATQVSNLETTVTNIPQTIRQPEPPDVNAFPLGSIWVDTDDANAIYILIEGPPREWSPTTSEALGDLILSNAALQDEVNLLSDDISAEATKLTTLTAQFGVYDPATDTFTINNNADVTSALRTYADSGSAAASKVDGINSVLNMVDASGNVIKNLATFNQEITTYVDANSSLSQSITNLNSTVGGLSTTVSQHTSSINGIEGKYGVTIDSNGNIAGFQLLNGTGGSAFNVSVDSFNIYSGTTNANVFTVDGGQVKLNVPLNGVAGTFTGRLTAGAVDIYNDNIDINIDTFGGQIKFIDDAGNNHTTLTASGPTGNFIILCEESISLLSKDGAGNNASSLQLRENFATLFTPGGHINLTTNTGVFVTASGESATFSAFGFDSFIFYAGVHRLQGSSENGITIASGINTLTVNSTGVYVNGQVLTGGGPTTDTNYYLQGVSINNSNGVITFDMNGTTDKTVDISTYVSNRISGLSGYALLSGATFTGNVLAPDFILSSDINLKENIKDYAVKPINIKYKSYNLIGNDQERVGVIAQELEVEHPEFVRENEEGIKSVSYIDMLVAKVAELEARINELEHGGRK
jgi:hypothetical protein